MNQPTSLSELFSKEFVSDVVGVFEQIEIAEQVIESYIGDPVHEFIWSSFKAFYSPILTKSVPDWLFRSHCKEIAQRIANIDGTTKSHITSIMKMPTRAEIVKICSEGSLTTPIAHQAYKTYMWLFCTICMEESIPIPDGLAMPEKPESYFLEEIFGCYKDDARGIIVYNVFNS